MSTIPTKFVALCDIEYADNAYKCKTLNSGSVVTLVNAVSKTGSAVNSYVIVKYFDEIKIEASIFGACFKSIN